jgi:hypothetical protein
MIETVFLNQTGADKQTQKRVKQENYPIFYTLSSYGWN